MWLFCVLRQCNIPKLSHRRREFLKFVRCLDFLPCVTWNKSLKLLQYTENNVLCFFLFDTVLSIIFRIFQALPYMLFQLVLWILNRCYLSYSSTIPIRLRVKRRIDIRTMNYLCVLHLWKRCRLWRYTCRLLNTPWTEYFQCNSTCGSICFTFHSLQVSWISHRKHRGSMSM